MSGVYDRTPSPHLHGELLVQAVQTLIQIKQGLHGAEGVRECVACAGLDHIGESRHAVPLHEFADKGFFLKRRGSGESSVNVCPPSRWPEECTHPHVRPQSEGRLLDRVHVIP